MSRGEFSSFKTGIPGGPVVNVGLPLEQYKLDITGYSALPSLPRLKRRTHTHTQCGSVTA